MYIDNYSVTHTVHNFNGSKPHAVRETQKSDNISVLKDYTFVNPSLTYCLVKCLIT